jgi:phospholipid/cholesterol/gamma-HCH transport system substrate-binding protein
MNEFKVGLLAVASLVSIAYMSLRVTSNQSGFGDYTKYRTIIKDATGIFPKTPIRVAGINAGRISDIELAGNSALIKFEIRTKVKIPEDSFLRIKSVGFLGDKYIDIALGKSEKRLDEGALIISKESASIERIVEEGTELISEMKKIVSSVRSSLSSDNGESSIKDIVNDVREILGNTKDVTSALKNSVALNEEKINSIINSIAKMSKGLEQELDSTSDESSRSKIKKILSNTEELSENLLQISRNIRQGRGTLGKFISEDKIADEVSQTLSGVNRIVNRLDLIRTEVSVFSGVNSEEGGDSRIRLRIYPSPERFYLFGASNSEFGPITEKITSTTTGNSTVETTESLREKNSFRFDAQFGRRVQDWTIRGGVIESSGGFGVDYHPSWSDSMFSLEGYDYRDSLGFNLRFSASTQIWNIVHARVMGEDLINDSRSYSFLLGLRFNDEDLRGLFSLIL